MSLEKESNKSNWMFVLKNFIAAGVLIVLMVVGALFAIDAYTKHGEVTTVPDLYGKYTEEATVILAKDLIKFQVIDSIYDRTKPLGSILEQTPPAGSVIKKYSTIYLIVNSQSIRQISVPELRDMSLRQAEAILKSIGLQIGRITYTPSEYNNLVLNIEHNGESVESGMKLAEQSSIDLTVGVSSEVGIPTLVPDLLGLTLEQARIKIIEAQMIVGKIEFDVPPAENEAEYIVVAQNLKSGSWESAGKPIDISMSLDRNKMIEQEETIQEEEFF